MTNLVAQLLINEEIFPTQPVTYTDAKLLAANVPESFTVPNGADGNEAGYVVFGSPVASDFFARPFTESEGADRVTNGDFATDTGWTKGTGWTIAAGVATATGAISTSLEQEAAVTTPLIEGQAYTVTYTATQSAGSVTINVGGTAGTARSTSATFTEIIIAGSTQTIEFTAAAFTGTVDDLTITAVATVPGDDSTGLASPQNPYGFKLDDAVSYISVVSSGTPIITASFYKR